LCSQEWWVLELHAAIMDRWSFIVRDKY